MLKIKLIYQFSLKTADLRILQFYWLKASWILTQEAEFSQIWDLCRNKVNNINLPSFNIKLRKKKRQNFLKNLKTVVLDHFRSLFAYFLAKRLFSKNYNTSVFRFLDLPSCTKTEKNQWVVINKNSQLAGRQIDRERYRQIDRQTDIGDFIGFSVYGGSKMNVSNFFLPSGSLYFFIFGTEIKAENFRTHVSFGFI